MANIDPDILKVLKLAGVEQPTERDIQLADRALQVTTGGHGELAHQRAAGYLQRWRGGVQAP